MQVVVVIVVHARQRYFACSMLLAGRSLVESDRSFLVFGYSVDVVEWLISKSKYGVDDFFWERWECLRMVGSNVSGAGQKEVRSLPHDPT